MRRNTRPAKAGLKRLFPKPPKDILAIPIATIEPMTTIHIGRLEGRLKASSMPVTTAEYGLSKAARPFNSRLDKSKLVEAGFTPLPTWQDALNRYLKEIAAMR